MPKSIQFCERFAVYGDCQRMRNFSELGHNEGYHVLPDDSLYPLTLTLSDLIIQVSNPLYLLFRVGSLDPTV